MMCRMHDHKGFTLIELMIVVAVIAILAAIAIPSYLGVQKRAARSEAKATLEAIALALEGYMAENNDYGPTGVYTYVCGEGCLKKSFVGFPAPLGTIANLGGGYDYDYQITVTTTPPSPAFRIDANPVRGRVAGDLAPFLQSDGTKGPANFGW